MVSVISSISVNCFDKELFRASLKNALDTAAFVLFSLRATVAKNSFAPFVKVDSGTMVFTVTPEPEVGCEIPLERLNKAALVVL